MVVSCPQCATRFNLDEGLITRESVKVRCSRCRHVFQVSRPDGPPAVALEEGVPPEEPIRSSDLVESSEVSTTPDSQAEESAEESARPSEGAPQEASPGEEALPLSYEKGGGQARDRRRAVIFSLAAGCLLGLLLGVLTLWYLGEKQNFPFSQVNGGESEVSLTPPLPPASPEEFRNLVIDLQEARYRGLVHPQRGQLLVIQGEVKNLTGEPRGPIRLKATLMDHMNRPLQEVLFYCGTRLSDEDLLQNDAMVINRWLATPGGRQGVKVVKPNDSQGFTAVFFGVPEDLAEARHGFHLTVAEAPRLPRE